MLYYFKGKVFPMLGTEKVSELALLKSKYSEKEFDELLTYVFFSYGRSKGNQYLDQPPTERKQAVIKDHKLFLSTNKAEQTWQYVEDMDGVQQFIKRYLETQYTHLQRLRLVILEKIEKYTNTLANPDAKFDDEVEADKALELFNRRLEEIEISIMKEEETGQTSQGAMYLYELPEEAKLYYKKINFEI